jgi:hypothetical protein
VQLVLNAGEQSVALAVENRAEEAAGCFSRSTDASRPSGQKAEPPGGRSELHARAAAFALAQNETGTAKVASVM